jgi:hypothetical protein
MAHQRSSFLLSTPGEPVFAAGCKRYGSVTFTTLSPCTFLRVWTIPDGHQIIAISASAYGRRPGNP